MTGCVCVSYCGVEEETERTQSLGKVFEANFHKDGRVPVSGCRLALRNCDRNVSIEVCARSKVDFGLVCECSVANENFEFVIVLFYVLPVV